MEKWEKIKNYEKYYEISNLGRIKSLERKVRNNKGFVIKPEKILIPRVHTGNYLTICLTVNRKSNYFYIHRLVAEHFIENIKNKKEVNHKDGNKQNNKVTNLEWSTRKENIDHSVQNKLHCFGEKAGTSKLKAYQVIEIRANQQMSLEEKAIKFNVSKATISRILNKKIWKHI